MTRSTSGLSRRATLGVALAAPVAAAGCGATKPAAKAVARPAATISSAPPTAPNPDQPLVDKVIAALGADRGAPASFRTLHATQVKALGPSGGSASAVPAPADWQQHQKQLLATLTDATVAARDPQLATLLASCAASQRQLLHGRGLA